MPQSIRLKGFTLIEVMIVFFVLSYLVLGVAHFVRTTQQTLQGGENTNSMRAESLVVRQFLQNDIAQVVFLNPSCDENQMNSAAVTDCDMIKIHGGITPLPGMTRVEVNALTHFLAPATLESNPDTLIIENDALRLILFNFSGVYNCALAKNHTGSNPSQTPGNGNGAERFWADAATCNGKLNVGGLYVLTETDSVTETAYANVLQITAIQDQGLELQIDAASSNNSFNQTGGLGLSGYTLNAMGELEFYLVSESSDHLYPLHKQQGYHASPPFVNIRSIT